MKNTYLSKKWNILINKISASSLLSSGLRIKLYRMFGFKEINTYNIRDNVFFYSNKITIGKGSFVNRSCYFYNTDWIKIGSEVAIAPEVMLCTNTHEMGNEYRRASEVKSSPIFIEDGSWIGARAIILPGVTIGKGCVIAAGSVVITDCLPNCLYAGVPAVKVKELQIENSIAI